MDSVIHELYHGNLNPIDRSLIPGSRLQQELNRLVANEKQLSLLLPEREKAMFLDYVASYGEVLSLCEEDKFIIGFRLGAHLTLDTFARDDAHTKDLLKE